jgi:hypothetical protein
MNKIKILKMTIKINKLFIREIKVVIIFITQAVLTKILNKVVNVLVLR